jgi:hypothetical protein
MSTWNWPTTLRFSRRLGEAYPDAVYACALEGPRPGHAYDAINRAVRSVRALVSRASSSLVPVRGKRCSIAAKRPLSVE